MQPQTVQSERLELIPGSPELLEAELMGRAELAGVLGREVSDDYPPRLYDESAVRFTRFRLLQHPEEAGWWSYYVALANGGPVVGVGGYKGLPDGYGVVEIGYSICDSRQRRGYGLEAASALVDHAFGLPGVTAILAHTMPELPVSIRLLEKCGFRFDGHADEPGVLRYRLDREAWASRRA